MIGSAKQIEAMVLQRLSMGPVKSFGSDRNVSVALTSLTKQGLVRYKKIKDGGKGWELVKP